MSDHYTLATDLPPEQQAIRTRCFHPMGSSSEFKIEDVKQSIPQRFEKIEHKYPDHVAIKAGNRIVTYVELNAMANCVGDGILDQRGAESELVPLLFEKGVDQIVTILAVLKAGKFFVLLDASSPAARIAATVKDLRAGVLLSHKQNAELA